MNEDGGHDLLNGLVVALVDDPDAVLASLVVSLALKQEEARIKWKGSRLGVLRYHVASARNLLQACTSISVKTGLIFNHVWPQVMTN